MGYCFTFWLCLQHSFTLSPNLSPPIPLVSTVAVLVVVRREGARDAARLVRVIYWRLVWGVVLTAVVHRHLSVGAGTQHVWGERRGRVWVHLDLKYTCIKKAVKGHAAHVTTTKAIRRLKLYMHQCSVPVILTTVTSVVWEDKNISYSKFRGIG